ncbi:serine/threonine protein kinase [Sediminibacillus dalangtanensis]|uniref:Serine/threonine protein kinase n=1 Tax=Sediminibacillus dalangtanensis TaxID=2729421 RepID=A0ABX7VX02_9BACI|nr:serine/threonine-protein kinase [Sediminibacillus dalangtanensis]QTN01523.1 serine/threonine protein kinase [Sediminibacillus dalangtanensis]
MKFQLQEEHDFSWLEQLGTVFYVFDQQDSGNISFGVEKDGQKYFVKYAGAKPTEFTGNPNDAVQRLKKAVPVYQEFEHPYLIELIDSFSTGNGFAVVFQWFEGECLHAHWQYGGKEKYTNPKSPFYRFRKLDVKKRLKALDAIFSFHTYVESKDYVAVDFYDGSILYDFQKDETKICDIDFYRKAPSMNDIGEEFWGSNRSKSPEEYKLGAPIDSITTVFNLGAIAFGLLGGERDRSYSKWEADPGLYEVAWRAVEEDRNKRYATVKDFYGAWKYAKNQ